MLAFISNLALPEISLIVVGAIIIFGKDLPQVLMRGMQHFAKLRRSVKTMWEEAGLEQEMRKVRADLEGDLSGFTSPKKLIQQGKDTLTKPVDTWRKNLTKDIEGSVPVAKQNASAQAPQPAQPGPTAKAGDFGQGLYPEPPVKPQGPGDKPPE